MATTKTEYIQMFGMFRGSPSFYFFRFHSFHLNLIDDDFWAKTKQFTYLPAINNIFFDSFFSRLSTLILYMMMMIVDPLTIVVNCHPKKYHNVMMIQTNRKSENENILKSHSQMNRIGMCVWPAAVFAAHTPSLLIIIVFCFVLFSSICLSIFM